MSKKLVTSVALFTVAFAAAGGASPDVTSAVLKGALASKVDEPVVLQTLRARDKQMLVDLANVLAQKYSDLLAGSELSFTQLTQDGSVFYRLDFKNLKNKDRAIALCDILQMESCIATAEDGSIMVLDATPGGVNAGDKVAAVVAVHSKDDQPFFLAQPVVAQPAPNPMATKVEAKVRDVLDPLQVYPEARPEILDRQAHVKSQASHPPKAPEQKAVAKKSAAKTSATKPSMEKVPALRPAEKRAPKGKAAPSAPVTAPAKSATHEPTPHMSPETKAPVKVPVKAMTSGPVNGAMSSKPIILPSKPAPVAAPGGAMTPAHASPEKPPEALTPTPNFSVPPHPAASPPIEQTPPTQVPGKQSSLAAPASKTVFAAADGSISRSSLGVFGGSFFEVADAGLISQPVHPVISHSAFVTIPGVGRFDLTKISAPIPSFGARTARFPHTIKTLLGTAAVYQPAPAPEVMIAVAAPASPSPIFAGEKPPSVATPENRISLEKHPAMKPAQATDVGPASGLERLAAANHVDRTMKAPGGLFPIPRQQAWRRYDRWKEAEAARISAAIPRPIARSAALSRLAALQAPKKPDQTIAVADVRPLRDGRIKVNQEPVHAVVDPVISTPAKPAALLEAVARMDTPPTISLPDPEKVAQASITTPKRPIAEPGAEKIKGLIKASSPPGKTEIGKKKAQVVLASAPPSVKQRGSGISPVVFDDRFADPSPVDFTGGAAAGKLQKLPIPRAAALAQAGWKHTASAGRAGGISADGKQALILTSYDVAQVPSAPSSQANSPADPFVMTPPANTRTGSKLEQLLQSGQDNGSGSADTTLNTLLDAPTPLPDPSSKMIYNYPGKASGPAAAQTVTMPPQAPNVSDKAPANPFTPEHKTAVQRPSLPVAAAPAKLETTPGQVSKPLPQVAAQKKPSSPAVATTTSPDSLPAGLSAQSADPMQQSKVSVHEPAPVSRPTTQAHQPVQQPVGTLADMRKDDKTSRGSTARPTPFFLQKQEPVTSPAKAASTLPQAPATTPPATPGDRLEGIVKQSEGNGTVQAAPQAPVASYAPQSAPEVMGSSNPQGNPDVAAANQVSAEVGSGADNRTQMQRDAYPLGSSQMAPPAYHGSAPNQALQPADLEIELAYVVPSPDISARQAVAEKAHELKKFFPANLLTKGRFFGATNPGHPGQYVVGIVADSARDRADLLWYMRQVGIPFAFRK